MSAYSGIILPAARHAARPADAPAGGRRRPKPILRLIGDDTLLGKTRRLRTMTRPSVSSRW